MNVLHIHKVYEFCKGRMVDMKDGPVPDIQAIGMAALTHGTSSASPLQEFNSEFKDMQARHNLVPVSCDAMASQHEPQHQTLSTSPTPCIPKDTVLVEAGEVVECEDENGEGENELEMADNDNVEFDLQSPTLGRWFEEDVDLDMDGFDLDAESENEDNGEGDNE